VNILEWGAGFSTLQFPKLLNYPFRWLSVEHDEQWHKQLIRINQHRDVVIMLQKPHNFPYTDEHGDGSYEDFRDYIEMPDNGTKYDLIIIDGRARNECILKAINILNTGGVILLHDANRKRYHVHFDKFSHGELFTDYRRSAGGIWLGSMDRELSGVVDIRKHQKRWRLVRNKVAKILSI
jgi:hypothetical protein